MYIFFRLFWQATLVVFIFCFSFSWDSCNQIFAIFYLICRALKFFSFLKRNKHLLYFIYFITLQRKNNKTFLNTYTVHMYTVYAKFQFWDFLPFLTEECVRFYRFVPQSFRHRFDLSLLSETHLQNRLSFCRRLLKRKFLIHCFQLSTFSASFNSPFHSTLFPMVCYFQLLLFHVGLYPLQFSF